MYKGILVACVLSALSLAQAPAPTAAQSSDPFIGKWKLNASKTDLKDKMKVESAGANKYTFNFGGGAETIRVDGTPQPGLYNSTLEVSAEGDATATGNAPAESPRYWKVVRKSNGQTMLTAHWTLSPDGKTLTDDFTQIGADGSPLNTLYVYRKKGAGEGFAGEWESISGTMKSPYLFEIRKWNGDAKGDAKADAKSDGEGDGLSFIDPMLGNANAKLDGKDYPLTPKVTAQASRVSDSAVQITLKVNGKPVQIKEYSLAPDAKSLTLTIREVAGGEPLVMLFDRQ